MSAPVRRRSVSLRRPIVNSGLSIGTIRRPSASVTISRGPGGGVMEARDYNGRIMLNEALSMMMVITKRVRYVSATLLFLLLAVPAGMHALPAQPAAQPPASMAPFWTGISDAASFERAMDGRLTAGRAALDALVAVKGPRTVENTLRRFDDILLQIDAAGSQAGLIQVVHPDEKVRTAAEQISQKVSAFATELSLNRAVYDAVAALDVSRADEETKYYLQRTLRDFRLAGVDRDEATRKRIQQLRDELTLVGQDFDRNIRTDLRKVIVKSATELEGLPADYVSRHKPEADGSITLTIDYPDSLPALS